MAHNWKSDKNAAERKGTMQACVECGTEFYVPPSQQGKRLRCSKECKAEFERKEVECTCQNCGETFTVKERDVRRGRGIYCGTTCTGRAKAKRARLTPRKKAKTLEEWEENSRKSITAILRATTRRQRAAKRRS